MVVEGHTGTVECCFEHDVSLVSLLALPGTGAVTGTRKGTTMDLLHPRCAGVDVSKCDAKV